MTLLEAIILGIVQGATEFLPISSSAHVIMIPSLLNLPEPGLEAISIAHLGTLLAVLIYFRRDLWAIAWAWLGSLRVRRPLVSSDSRLGWYILLGSLPAVVAGYLLLAPIGRLFGQPMTAAWLLYATAALLVASEQLYRPRLALEGMRPADALLIGIAQAFALLPGISRSGSTIAAGLGLGLKREAAGRFSFLLGVPAIAGAGLLALLDLLQSAGPASQWRLLLLTFALAFGVGYACIAFLLAWLRRRRLYLFAVYCVLIASLYLINSPAR
ncbi:MAG: undecaprenyl-diphosphate phosphatase [Candidatus Promineifilaceae bacterium]